MAFRIILVLVAQGQLTLGVRSKPSRRESGRSQDTIAKDVSLIREKNVQNGPSDSPLPLQQCQLLSETARDKSPAQVRFLMKKVYSRTATNIGLLRQIAFYCPAGLQQPE